MKLTGINTNHKTFNTLKQRVDNYIAPFITGNKENDSNIILKKNHTKRVCLEILYITEQLGLDETEKIFCEITALFHDIGRFEQYRKFRTFSDADSVDHAKFGCEIMETENFLDILSPYEQELIKKTVLYHNRLTVPENETPDCLFCSRLLRDADKLDIWHVVTSYYRNNNKKRNKTLELDLPDTPGISDRVYTSLMNEKIVCKEDMQNLNDFKMLQMSWVYDLNFPPSFKRLAEKEYLKKIKEALSPNDKKIESVYRDMIEYLYVKTGF